LFYKSLKSRAFLPSYFAIFYSVFQVNGHKYKARGPQFSHHFLLN